MAQPPSKGRVAPKAARPNPAKLKRKKKPEVKLTKGTIMLIVTMCVGLLLSLVSIFGLSSSIVITNWGILTLYGIFAAFGCLVYFIIHKVEYSKEKLNIPFFLTFNIVGVGGVLVFLFLLFNNILASDKVNHEYYKIVGTDPEYKIYRWGLVVYLLEGDQFQHDVYLRSLEFKFHSQMPEGYGTIEYDFYRGGFGFRKKGEHRLVLE
ncbi:MAG: hypothetical protein HRT71_06640 [Flavobacteriales bacterium]|nr:hypothetical protein [Flavobacteriales bacterium]